MTFPSAGPGRRPHAGAGRPRRLPSAGRAIGLLAAAASLGSVAAIIPAAPRAAVPGHLEAAVIPLSGPGAVATAPASDRRSLPTRPPARTLAPGWSADVDVDDATQQVALTWSGAPEAAIEVRALGDDGSWAPWTVLAADPDEAPDAGGNGRTGVGPLFLGSEGTDAVQVRLTSGTVTDLALDAMHWVPPVAGTGAGAEPSGGTIHLRSEWAPGGWRGDLPDCTPAPIVMDRLRFAVVHHTVNANTYAAADVPGILAGIYRYHTEDRAWCDIAYNFVIDRFGRVWQGRSGDVSLPIMGGHAKGFNADSVGVALLGQHEAGGSPAAAAPTAAELDALSTLLAWKLAIHGLDADARISVTSTGSTRYPKGTTVTLPRIQGHIDTSYTDCPGSLVRSKLDGVRTAVASKIAAAASPATWAPLASGTAFFGQQLLDARGRPGTNTEAAHRTSLVVRDGRSRDQLATDLVVSPATDDRIGSVGRLYQAFFLRRPDPAGLDYHVRRHDAGQTLERTAATFASSSEFRDRYGTLTDARFVDRVYRNVLLRPPDAAGADYWERKLAAGMTRAHLMVQFTTGGEFTRRLASESKVTVIWYVLLHRAPDPAAYDTWIPRFDAGTSARTAVSSVLASVEYRTRVT